MLELNAAAGIDEEAIAAFLQATENQEPPRRAPKAGRRAVKQLEVISPIDAATLERLGGPGTACSICTWVFSTAPFL